MEPRARSVTSQLGKAFVEDHRHLIRGFTDLKSALEQGDLDAARRIADQLDRAAGSHIRFEEEVLYPRVAEVRGRAFADRLYAEHAVGRAVIRQILDLPEGSALDPALRDQCVAGTGTALDHVLRCGTLLSHLTAPDASQQAELLDVLEAMRRHPRRWTELPEHGRAETDDGGH
jgi:hypothetical protein